MCNEDLTVCRRGRSRFLRLALSALTSFFLAAATPASAAMVQTYRMAIDLGNDPGSGCDFSLGTLAAPLPGFELQVTVQVDTEPMPPQVVLGQVEQCQGAAFGAPVPLLGASFALNSGFAGADSVIASIPTDLLSGARFLRLAFHALSFNGAEDMLFSSDGSGDPAIPGDPVDPDAPAIIFAVTQPAQAPALNYLGVALALLILAVLAFVRLRQHRSLIVASVALLALAGTVVAVYAASVLGATDDLDDSTPPDNQAEIYAAGGMIGGSVTDILLDIEDIENAPPTPTSTPTSTPTNTPEIEVGLVAEKVQWDFDDGGGMPQTFAMAYRLSTDPVGSGTIPGPLIEGDAADRVAITLINNLPALPDADFTDELTHTVSSLHPHGVELNNVSDGTGVTQNPTAPAGGVFFHGFVFKRPGLFFYHPHAAPLDQVFHGLYGPIVVSDDADEALTTAGILPTRSEVLVVASVTLDTDAPNVGKIKHMEDQTGNDSFGNVVIVNGKTTGPTLAVESGEGIRLRLYNPDIFRYFVFVFSNGTGGDDTIFRVGGEEGLLDNVRIEGGTLPAGLVPGDCFPAGANACLDTRHAVGTIMLGPAMREDVVIVPSGNNGDVATLSVFEFAGLPNPFDLAGGQVVATFNIGAPAAMPFAIADGDPLRVLPAVNDPVEDLKVLAASNLVDPTTLPVPIPPLPAPEGSTNPIITLSKELSDPNDPMSALNNAPAIDGIHGGFDGAMLGDFTEIPHIASTRWGQRGDVLELAVQNTTTQPHPFHLHGFSMQPIKIESLAAGTIGDVARAVDQLLFTWDYTEFRDVINVPTDTRITFRVILDDRPQPDGSAGGADGRWLFHCHIFRHAAQGMISELVVVP